MKILVINLKYLHFMKTINLQLTFTLIGSILEEANTDQIIVGADNMTSIVVSAQPTIHSSDSSSNNHNTIKMEGNSGGSSTYYCNAYATSINDRSNNESLTNGYSKYYLK